MEEDSRFGLPWLTPMRRPPALLSLFTLGTFATVAALALWSATGLAGPAASGAAPNVRGKISGYEKLVPDVYADAARLDAKRFTWREPSPSVATQFRVLSANPSRDICIAVTAATPQEKQEFGMRITGGRVIPTTIVVTPNTTLSFKNYDPFKHRLYIVNGNTKVLVPEDVQPNNVRSWAPQGAGKFEIRDELFPSIHSYVIVDPQVVSVTYPGRDGSFGFNVPAGDYVLKAFFNGHPVGRQIQVTAKDRGTFEMKEPFKLDEGSDGK